MTSRSYECVCDHIVVCAVTKLLSTTAEAASALTHALLVVRTLANAVCRAQRNLEQFQYPHKPSNATLKFSTQTLANMHTSFLLTDLIMRSTRTMRMALGPDLAARIRNAPSPSATVSGSSTHSISFQNHPISARIDNAAIKSYQKENLPNQR